MANPLAEKIVRNALAEIARKDQPGSSGVHVPSTDWRVQKADMSPPINNLEATMIDAAFEPVVPEKPIAKSDDESRLVEKAELTTEGRKHIAESNFALSGRRYPIQDISHARNALARSSGKSEESQVKAAVYRKYPSLKENAKKSGAPTAEPRRVSTVAVRHGDNMLFGKRRDNGKWTTPGGHANPGEDHHQAAHRELEEETGLKADPKDMKSLADVHKMTDREGKPLHVQPFEVSLKDKPSTSMKGDPDGEVHRWRWFDVSEGLPEEIASDLHVPAEYNVLLKACGLVAPEAEPAVKDGLDSDDALGCDLPPELTSFQALTSGVDYEMAAGGLGTDEATQAAVNNLKSDPGYYDARWADVNGVDSADLLNKSGDDAGPNGLSLDLASGQARKPGYIGLDLYPFDHGTIVHDLHTGIPFPDRSATNVRLVNAPDVTADENGSRALMSDLKRVVAPGGQFFYEGANQLDCPEGFDEDSHGDKVDKAYNVTEVEQGAPPVYRQVFIRRANPDAAAGNDAYPRLGVAQSDMLPADAALALDALGDFWSDNTTSGRGNRLYGYPSQGALVEKLCPIAKISPEKQIVYCVVLSPDEIDEDDDYMFAEDIEKAAHDYLLNSRVIGDTHGKQAAAAPVESYICPADCEWTSGPYGPQVVKKGAWVIGIRIFDKNLWEAVKNGEYQSVSVGGAGLRDPLN